MACLNPIPLRACKLPPVIPVATREAKAERRQDQPETGVIALMNVYDAAFDWPRDLHITALRIVQLYPKSTYHLDEPMAGVARESLTRGSLETVPIESDGSAHLEAPAGAAPSSARACVPPQAKPGPARRSCSTCSKQGITM